MSRTTWENNARAGRAGCPFVYGAITRYGVPFQASSTRARSWLRGPQCPSAISHYPRPATPAGLTRDGFRLIPFRSPLLRESLLLFFPRATKMFQFARLPPPALFYSGGGDAALPASGFPIRVPPGQSLLAARRGSIVACYALLRPPVPRHPSCALSSLVTKENALSEVSLRSLLYHYAVVKVRHYFSHPACTPVERRPHSCSFRQPLRPGGDGRARTGDLLRAREALSQLSYVPSSWRPACRAGPSKP